MNRDSLIPNPKLGGPADRAAPHVRVEVVRYEWGHEKWHEKWPVHVGQRFDLTMRDAQLLARGVASLRVQTAFRRALEDSARLQRKVRPSP